MSPVKHQFFALIAVSIFAAACTNSSNLDGDPGAEIEPQVFEESIPLIDVCDPLDIPGVAFPRQEYVEGSRETMEAELIGDFLLVDGYLQIKSLYGDGFVMPVWPAEFTVALVDGSYIVLDGDGNQVAREEKEVYMGGGEGSEMGMLDCVRQQLSESYTGKYWYVGEGCGST